MIVAEIQWFFSTSKYYTIRVIAIGDEFYTIIMEHTFAASNQAYVDTINKAIKQFDDYTCLKWVPRGSAGATASYGSYIEFFSGRYFENTHVCVYNNSIFFSLVTLTS